MKNICIIPARGGSKRIPRKNIKDFLGKPIIAYSIEAALNSNLFDEVMVSTDDEEIAEIAKKHGAKVPFMRSVKNSNDFATTFDVIEEVIAEYKSQGIEFEKGCCIYSCAPFTTSKKIQEAFDKLKEQDFDTVFPVVPYGLPIQRALKIQEGKIIMFNEEHKNTRSQDLEKSYHDTGQFYWFNKEAILNKRSLLTDNVGAIIVSELECQDIDTEMDWKMAEIKFEMRIK